MEEWISDFTCEEDSSTALSTRAMAAELTRTAASMALREGIRASSFVSEWSMLDLRVVREHF